MVWYGMYQRAISCQQQQQKVELITPASDAAELQGLMEVSSRQAFAALSAFRSSCEYRYSIYNTTWYLSEAIL
jgi:hypothetical protein